MAAEGRPVHAMDVFLDPRPAMALGVIGTPTVVMVRDGQVADVLVGAQSPERLRELIGAVEASSV